MEEGQIKEKSEGKKERKRGEREVFRLRLWTSLFLTLPSFPVLSLLFLSSSPFFFRFSSFLFFVLSSLFRSCFLFAPISLFLSSTLFSLTSFISWL